MGLGLVIATVSVYIVEIATTDMRVRKLTSVLLILLATLILVQVVLVVEYSWHH